MLSETNLLVDLPEYQFKAEALRDGESVLRIYSLRVKCCGEIAVEDVVVQFVQQGRFWVVADAEACSFEHGKIVGPVADGESFIKAYSEFLRILI